MMSLLACLSSIELKVSSVISLFSLDVHRWLVLGHFCSILNESDQLMSTRGRCSKHMIEMGAAEE